MKHFIKHNSGATVFGDDGSQVFFTRAGNMAMGSDGSMVTSSPDGTSFTVTSPDGGVEFFTSSPQSGTAFGSNGTNITVLDSSTGMIFGA